MNKTYQVKNMKELRNHYSPSIPQEFPASKLPSQLCERTLLDVMTCMEHYGPPDNCGVTVLKYYDCKKLRDSIIFTRIKQWEKKRFSGLENREDRLVYIEELQKKKQALKQRLESTPTEAHTSHLIYRIKTDAEQLDWRMEYLSDIL